MSYPVAGAGVGPCGTGGAWGAATIALVLFVLLVIILRAGI
ncbi:sporulation protein YjcZ [Cohnella fermenti]|uniref:Sporulation protein YjcZ n=1 Tax=Cohnella fermenti TaxID=2565925 RepID=A0A4S4BLR2_9BACL|nr:sporulation protein YjcZ [Cohnella fermenti]